MILIIIITVIVIAVVYKEANKPVRKSADYYARHKELQGDYVFHCKDLSTTESFMNLGQDSKGLEYLAYHNRQLYVRMKDGRTLQGMIENMSARFSATSRGGGLATCELISGNKKVTIITIWHLFTDEEWWQIFNLLTHCGTTYNLKEYIEVYKLYNTQEGKITRGMYSAAKVISYFS